MIQTAKKEAKAKKKREQTAIVGDLRPLEDTLPTLELLLKDTGHHKGARSVCVCVCVCGGGGGGGGGGVFAELTLITGFVLRFFLWG